MSELVHIRKPFVTAGRQYGWLDKYAMVGVGINQKFLMDGGWLDIQIGNSETVYRINKSAALELARKYRSTYYCGVVRLVVLPLDAFKVVPMVEAGQSRLFGGAS